MKGRGRGWFYVSVFFIRGEEIRENSQWREFASGPSFEPRTFRKRNDRDFRRRGCSNWINEKGNKQKYSSATPCRLVNTRSLQMFRSSLGSVIHEYVGKYVLIAVPSLAHERPDCDSCGGSLIAVFQS